MTHTCIPDTDSIHMLKMNKEELKQFVDIDDYRLGAWKLESEFTRGRFIRQKCYIEENEITEENYVKGLKERKNVYCKNGHYYELNTTVAGMTPTLHKYVNFDNFEKGLSLLKTDTSIDKEDYKLRFKHVNGGVLLVDTDFTIK